ncbi:MAG: type II toxin-antitoxin system VapC family toxin [Actinomycetota bacterium]|nr:type II toxin-antitoxin system VapC family toxin [Actinomycetota bacterium]
MIVVDASVLVTALTDGGAEGALSRNALASSGSLHAPHLLDVEVTAALRGLALGNRIDASDAATAIADLVGYPIARYDHAPLLERTFELRDVLTTYDAMYVALAELLETYVLTGDRRMARAVASPDLVRVLEP